MIRFATALTIALLALSPLQARERKIKLDGHRLKALAAKVENRKVLKPKTPETKPAPAKPKLTIEVHPQTVDECYGLQKRGLRDRLPHPFRSRHRRPWHNPSLEPLVKPEPVDKLPDGPKKPLKVPTPKPKD